MVVAVSGAICTLLLPLYICFESHGLRDTTIDWPDEFINTKRLKDDIEMGTRFAFAHVDRGERAGEIGPGDTVGDFFETESFQMVGGYMLIVWPRILIAYALARSFMVVESFISLRALPANAYKTPNWTNLLLYL